jgi:hypothetical protein
MESFLQCNCLLAWFGYGDRFYSQINGLKQLEKVFEQVVVQLPTK